MTNIPPIIYCLHGEDEFAIKQFVSSMQEKIGDKTVQDMNISEFAGKNIKMESLRASAMAAPFLATRRIIILDNGLSQFSTKTQKEKFLSIISTVPQTTALIISEYKKLPATNWLLKWVKENQAHCYVKEFGLPKGPQMVKWIRDSVKSKGGEISSEAASYLREIVSDNPRVANLEIDKLLAYVNFARMIEFDDVEAVGTVSGGQGDFFALIDSITSKDQRKSSSILNNLLSEQPPLMLFFSVVGHFRLLLQTREIIDGGGIDGTVAKSLSIHPFRAKKLAAQAKTLSKGFLDETYKQLQQYDFEIKTGKIQPDLALELLFTALTTR
jgi:DNA polymerase III subunit delta